MKLIVSAMIFTLLILPLTSKGQTPFTYSGRLADAGTGKSPSGPTDLVIRVYAAGAVVCSKSLNDVILNKGRFSVSLDYSNAECGGTDFSDRIQTAVGANQKIEMEVQDVTNGVTHSRTLLGVTPLAMFSLNEGIANGSLTSRKMKGFPVCLSNETFEILGNGDFNCRVTPGLGSVTQVGPGSGVVGPTTTTTGVYSLDIANFNSLYYRRLGPFNFTADFDMNAHKMGGVGTATDPTDMVTMQGVANSIATVGAGYLKDVNVNGNTGTYALSNGSGNLNILGATSGGVTITTDFNPPGSNNLEISISGFGLGTVETVSAGTGITQTGTAIIPVVGLSIPWWDGRYVNIDGTNSVLSGDLYMGDGTTNYLIKNLLPPLQPMEIANRAYTLGRVTTYAGDITEVVAGDGLAGGAVTGTAVLDAVANHGIIIDASTIGVDETVIQKRVSGTCAINSSIREIRQDGTVVCEMDSGAIAGDIEAVNSGAGISVISPDGPAPIVNIDGIYWDNRYMREDGAFAMQVNGQIDMDNNRIIGLDDPIGMNDMVNMQYFNSEILANAGDITGMTAGNGLTGTAMNGDVDFVVGAGPGIFVSADYVSLDVSFLDPFYLVPNGSSTMTGNISFGTTRKATNVPTPTAAGDLANKQYADTILDPVTNFIDAITAGAGLTGGGGAGTVNIDVAGTAGITVNADDVQVSPQGVVNTQFSGVAANCTGGQVLKTDGSGSFSCAADSDANYIAGPGIIIGANQLSLDSAVVMVAGVTAAGGDLNGTLPDPTVDGIRTRPVTATVPTLNQVLEWNGAAWAPATDDDTIYTADNTTLELTGTVFSIKNDGLNNSHFGSVLTGADFQDGSLSDTEFTGAVINNTNDFAATLCANGDVLRRGALGWECSPDANNVYTAGAGLNLAVTVFSIPASGITSAMITDGSVYSAEITDGTIAAADMNTTFIDATNDFDNAACASDYQIFAKAAGVWGCVTDAASFTGSLGIDVAVSGPAGAPTSGVVEVNVPWWEGRYVNVAGDTMTGSLEIPQLFRTSDRRLKKNIVKFENSLAIIKKLNGVRFDWKESGEPDIGFIAQEVEEVVPEVVNTNKKGMKSVGYTNLLGIVIEAIKELKLNITKLTGLNELNSSQNELLDKTQMKNNLLKKKVALLKMRVEKQERLIKNLERD